MLSQLFASADEVMVAFHEACHVVLIESKPQTHPDHVDSDHGDEQFDVNKCKHDNSPVRGGYEAIALPLAHCESVLGAELFTSEYAV